MKLGLEGKTALIGGASKGLGKACALQLAQEGVNLAICARELDSLNETANEIRIKSKVKVLPIQADLSNIGNIKMIVDQTQHTFGTIDILIINSGGPRAGKFFDITPVDWENAFRSVLYYVIELYRLVIPIMKENKWGRIINISSSTVKEPSENLILSNVFRSGVVSLAKTLSRDLIRDNITINNISPAAFKTDRAIQLMLEQSKSLNVPLAEIEQKIVDGLPLKRFNHPDELANLVLFIASDLASGITGTTIQIDGGLQKFIF